MKFNTMKCKQINFIATISFRYSEKLFTNVLMLMFNVIK